MSPIVPSRIPVINKIHDFPSGIFLTENVAKTPIEVIKEAPLMKINP